MHLADDSLRNTAIWKWWMVSGLATLILNMIKRHAIASGYSAILFTAEQMALQHDYRQLPFRHISDILIKYFLQVLY